MPWTFNVELYVQMLKFALSCNDKESFINCLDPDGDVDHPFNVQLIVPCTIAKLSCRAVPSFKSLPDQHQLLRIYQLVLLMKQW